MSEPRYPQVLVLTDSLGFPRAEPERVAYEESYIALLKRAHPGVDFVHLGIGGGTIADLWKFSSYYREAMRPDLVVIQSGIVDCAPRALRLVEQQALSQLGPPGRWILRFIQRHSVRLRRARRLCYTAPAAFANYKREFERAFACPVCWVGILPAQPEYEHRLPGIAAAIRTYDGLLRERAEDRFVDLADFGSAETMSDHHHLSRQGHRRLFERLDALVRRHLDPRRE